MNHCRTPQSDQPKCLIVGAGLSGLVTAKELIEVGINDLIILEKSPHLGGVWSTHAWPNATLTSSKWITEFSSYPMPEDYPDFPTPDQMVAYLQSFAQHFDLEKYICYGISVTAIQKNDHQTYDVITTQNTYKEVTYVVIGSGLHGKPKLPDIPGLDRFSGTVLHSQGYEDAEAFRGQRVLCIGSGESGVGISSEISGVAQQTMLSAQTLAIAPRVYPYSNLPYDQTAYWQIAKWVRGFQHVATVAASWYGRLPDWVQSRFAEFHPILRRFPKPWLPTAWAPYRWHCKYWPRPTGVANHRSGNLTQPDYPTDDILYLVETGQIKAQGQVTHFKETTAYFEDGSGEPIDAVICNTGYYPGVLNIQFPDGWIYEHRDLYKGCLHPDLPNLAFVGLVRPSIGSIPAMAEMQARLVAQVFAKRKPLPPPLQLKRLIAQEFRHHARQCPTMQERFPHVYAFEAWMDDMAQVIGCQPKLWHHLGSWPSLRAYWMGAMLPLRFRMQGVGAIAGAKEKYIARTTRLFSHNFTRLTRNYMVLFLFYPHVLTVLIALFLCWGLHLSVYLSLTLAASFWLAYMTLDVFCFFSWWPVILLDYFLFLGRGIRREKPFENQDIPDYRTPQIFQQDTMPKST